MLKNLLHRPRRGSMMATVILVAIGISHLFDHYGGGNALTWLLLPLVPLLWPEAFLSSGIRTPGGGARYIAGVVLNSYLWGYALAGLFHLFRIVMAKLPKRAFGVCPTCGYDLRGSAGDCPECGAPRPEAKPSG